MSSKFAVRLQKVLVLSVLLSAHLAFAQGYLDGYLGLGFQPNTSVPEGFSAANIGLSYSRTIRQRLIAGADFHGMIAGGADFHFWGAGPRLAVSLGQGSFTPYAEGVFGTATDGVFSKVFPYTESFPNGQVVGYAFGFDYGKSLHWKFRLQCDEGHAGDGVDVTYSGLTFGLLLRFKTR
jgi:hypothetical protein